METEVKALCVRVMDYKDNDKLLTLLTAEKGKIAVQMRSVKSPKSKLKISASPFCYGEYNLSEKNGRYIVTGVQTLDSFFEIWQDINKYSAAEIVIECADKTTIEKSECLTEMVLAIKALTAINYGEVYPFVVSVWFIAKLMLAIGYDAVQDMEYSDSIIDLISGLQGLEVDELECLDITQQEVLCVLQYVSRYSYNIFGSKINSIVAGIKATTINC